MAFENNFGGKFAVRRLSRYCGDREVGRLVGYGARMREQWRHQPARTLLPSKGIPGCWGPQPTFGRDLLATGERSSGAWDPARVLPADGCAPLTLPSLVFLYCFGGSGFVLFSIFSPILFPREPSRSSWPWPGMAPTMPTLGRASPAWATLTTMGSQVSELYLPSHSVLTRCAAGPLPTWKAP